MKYIYISVLSSWIFSHREDEEKPIEYLARTVRATLGGRLAVSGTALSTARFLLAKGEEKNADELIAALKNILETHYENEEIGFDAVVKDEEDKEASDTQDEDGDKYDVLRSICARAREAQNELGHLLSGTGEEGEKDEAEADAQAQEHEKTFGPTEKALSEAGLVSEEEEKRIEERAERRARKEKKVQSTQTEEEKQEAARKAEEEREQKLAACMERIRATVGGEEFKRLAEELLTVAPVVIRDKTFLPFAHQAYLFSINDGCGCSTYLSDLAELLSHLGVLQMATRRTVTEIILEKDKDDHKGAALRLVERALDDGDKKAVRVLCIDISEWMSSVRSKDFNEILRAIGAHMEEFVFVFRVPFVDKEVLENLRYALDDLVFVRAVSIPPFTKAELQAHAKAEFAKFNFHMTDPAWELFHARIIEEKSDGRFYGVNTVKKVAWEIIYNKQLGNARGGRDDKSITKRDLAELCRDPEGNLTGEQMLDRLVGADAIKEKIREIVSQIVMSHKNPALEKPCIHMRFLGNPGTGKTTVARIVGKMLKEAGVLRVGNFYEYAGRDFCGRYVGETAPKTASICRDAYGSVLFIDEAYALYRGDNNDRDYGREALETLIAEMENHRSDMVVIMAGYTEDMQTLMRGNAGLASRMPYVIDFPNFTREQLYEIFVSMVTRQAKHEEGLFEAAREYFLALPNEFIRAKEFSNARFVRNIFERTVAKGAMRCQLAGRSTLILSRDDFTRASADKEFSVLTKKKNKIGFFE